MLRGTREEFEMLKKFARLFEPDKKQRGIIYRKFLNSTKNLRDFLADRFANGCIKKLIEAVKQKISDSAKRDAFLGVIS